ncbi:helix-turn-helix domain-containing protein [Sediminispirochaeta smaragdinae]|uniref:Transcriptional regulator, XRE family n=1 Tax=Sediminispirochaeta smaragdinae (strain DSM 11293 / JCM 15392 / SEBR 4228) TaxID=573413 RepID=E1RBK8_SEDSS|nr:helix-turn-helix transcriptional regulator [Sediminispirochaeta smaragdinae]ADK79738.1 transcriptional regulator, XRE family [Sediminispirochaeta smaragdinae DSM 11293]
MVPDKSTIGRNIRSYRKACGLSQASLGEKVGVSYQQIQKYENGASSISAFQLGRIAEILAVPIDCFFHLDTESGAEAPPAYSSEIGDEFLRVSQDERKLLLRYREIKTPLIKKYLQNHMNAIRELERNLDEE